jgi:Zn-dependent protease
MTDATSVLFQIAILVMSVVIHEVSHGIAAYLLGDKTAHYAGRLTLNPLSHLDPFGSVILPFLLVITQSPFLIGWAKPVPYNPYNLRDQKWGPAIVGAAGPASNFIMAIIFGLCVRLGHAGLFTFIPAAPLVAFLEIASLITFINIILGVFNLVPIPPLDGSKVLFALFPYQWHRIQNALEIYGWILLILFIFGFSWIIGPISSLIFKLITGI